MRQKGIISVLFCFFSVSTFSQNIKIDTLYTGLNKASSLAVTGQAIFIVESGAHRVLKLDLNGNFLQKYGNKGSGNYQFDNPLDIATTTGLKIYVSDPGNNRIQVFDRRWQYLSTIQGNEKFQTRDHIKPGFIDVSKLGDVFFYDEASKSIGRYNEDGTQLDQIPLPKEVKKVSGLQAVEDQLFILDKKAKVVHQISDNGFYQSYFPAESIQSFYSYKAFILGSGSTSIQELDKTEGFRKIEWENTTDVKDMLATDKFIYLLSQNALLKIFR